jgi:hypothetical protein
VSLENEMRRVGSMHGEKRNTCGISVRNSEGKRLLGRPRRRWDDNNKMALRVIG